MAWIPNVNPNELITSAWGNQIRDRTVTPFVNAAERTAAIPTPAAGMFSYLTATDSLEYWNGAAWLRVGPAQLAYKATGADQAGIVNTTVDITGTSATVTVAAGRRIQLTADVGYYKAPGDGTGSAAFVVADGSNTALRTVNAWVVAPSFAQIHTVVRINPPTGANTYKLRASTGVGFLNILAGATLMVEDVGPSSMPT